jgi:hypothetical protein
LNKVRLLRSISEFINPSTIADGGTITLWELIGEATYHLFPSEKGFNIYLLGAAGLNVGLISDIGVLVPGQSASITEGTTDADFMASAGLGTRFKIARNVSIFLEGRVSRLLGRGDNLLYTPLRAGFIF